MAGGRERHPRLAAGEFRGLRLDRFRAHARHDRERVFGSCLADDGLDDGGSVFDSDDLRWWSQHHPSGEGWSDQARGRSPAGTSWVCPPLGTLAARSPVVPAVWVGARVLWKRLRWRRARRDAWAGILAVWRGALGTLDLAGVRRRNAETYLELAGRVAATGVLSAEAELAFADLALLATTASYGDAPAADTRARQAERDAATVVRSARRRIARWQRIASALDPRGLAL